MRLHPPTIENIKRAATCLREGRLVSFPTETVYGLGADAESDQAVTAIFTAKGRPRFNPLIVHVASLQMATKIAEFNGIAARLAEQFWPGPLTLVLPRKASARISWLVTAGLETVAIRWPNHPVAQALLQEFGSPVAAPSANTSGLVSSTSATHVAESLSGSVAMILDGGATPLGIESTIVGLFDAQPVLLRPGALPREDIERITGKLTIMTPENALPNAPGQLKKHYATIKPLRLNAHNAQPDEALLTFGPEIPDAQICLNLSHSANLQEAASNLFAMLRQLDKSAARRIAVMPIPNSGLGEAINDRLERAAARD